MSLTTSLPKQSRTAASPRNPSPVEVFLASQGSPHTRRAFAQALVRAASVFFEVEARSDELEALPWSELRYHDLERLKARLLGAGYAVNTVNLTLVAARGLLRHARRLRLLTPDDFEDIRDVRRVKGKPPTAGRALSATEIARLFSAVAALPSPLRERDGALLAIAFTTGARRAEISNASFADLGLEDRVLLLRSGKGRRSRRVYLTGAASERIAAWTRVRGQASGPLLCPVAGGGRVLVGARLSESAVYRRFRTLSKLAGIKAASPHDARRTVATRMLAAGVDVNTVAAQTGHASLQVLRRYDRRGEDVLHQAVDRTLTIREPRPDWETSSPHAGDRCR